MFPPTNVSFHIYSSFKTIENIVYLLYIIITYCNIDNPTYDMHLFYTYRLPHGDFIILGSLVPLLFPISIESIVFCKYIHGGDRDKFNSTKQYQAKSMERYIDDVFSLWNCNRNEVERFIEEANSFHPTIKFTTEISENEITFLDTVVFKGERFIKESILDIKTHYKPTETFQYTHFTSCHPPGVKRGFIKGEAMRLLRTNFRRRLEARGYPKEYIESNIESSLSEVTFDSRQSALKSQKHKTAERILPFVTTYHPAVNKLKQIVMKNWRFIENQPMLKTIFKNPPIISYKRGKSLKDMLVRAKL